MCTESYIIRKTISLQRSSIRSRFQCSQGCFKVAYIVPICLLHENSELTNNAKSKDGCPFINGSYQLWQEIMMIFLILIILTGEGTVRIYISNYDCFVLTTNNIIILTVCLVSDRLNNDNLSAFYGKMALQVRATCL